jgi:hypothetical protein
MFDYQSLSPRVGEQEFVAVDLGMLQGMSITWDYLVEYVQELHNS